MEMTDLARVIRIVILTSEDTDGMPDSPERDESPRYGENQSGYNQEYD